MANREKGQHGFTALGRSWILEFTPNAFCDLEELTGKSTGTFLQEVEAGAGVGDIAFKDARRLFWVGLTEHHDDITEKEAGKIMHDLGGLAAAMEVMGAAIKSAFPDGEADPGNGEAATAK